MYIHVVFVQVLSGTLLSVVSGFADRYGLPHQLHISDGDSILLTMVYSYIDNGKIYCCMLSIESKNNFVSLIIALVNFHSCDPSLWLVSS